MYDVLMDEDTHIIPGSCNPKPNADQCGGQEGSTLEVLSRSGQIAIRRKSYDLADMLAEITPDNLHSEWEVGEVRGKEIW